MSSTPVQTAVVIALLLAVQAPSAQREEPPSLAQMRETVSRLRGNRIATPNNHDTLTTEQKHGERFSSLPPKLNEPAILAVAKHWSGR